MKKSLLILFLFASLFANATHIQINFVSNFNITIINPHPGSPSEGTATTNSDINTILSNYNISQCIDSFNVPNPVLFIDYTGNNINSLVSDLQNNINVLKVSICPNDINNNFIWADKLYLELVSNTNGNPVGTNPNGSIITTNNPLNSIFDTYQVKSMTKITPNLSYYEIHFDGNINNLLNDLNNLGGVIKSTETIGVGMLLNIKSFENAAISIYPNPFLTTFSINTSENISEYSVFDISGKLRIKSQSKSDLDTKTPQLTSGIYLLKIQFENGKSTNYKLIKK